MQEKIKNFFGFMWRAWCGSIRGKAGILLILFAAFMFVRIFWGEVNVQKFVINIWRLNEDRAELATQVAKRNTLKQHIELLQGYSPDYVEELGLKYLNIGNPKVKILKI